MADRDWDLLAADDYIAKHTLDNEDWFDAEDNRKIALLNVSYDTLAARFKRYLDDTQHPLTDIPDAATYAFAATLAWVFNDTNKMAQQGVASMSIRGMSITFKDWAKQDLYDFIPDSVNQIIGIPKQRVIPLVM